MVEMWNSRIRIDSYSLPSWAGKNAKNKIMYTSVSAYTEFYFSIYFPFKIKLKKINFATLIFLKVKRTMNKTLKKFTWLFKM